MARLDDEVLAHARDLRLVMQYGVGVEGVDIDAATRRGIWVSKVAPGIFWRSLLCHQSMKCSEGLSALPYPSRFSYCQKNVVSARRKYADLCIEGTRKQDRLDGCGL